MQSVQAYISPPIAAVFLIGILWRRVNAQGAMAALLTGFVLGMARLLAELNAGRLDGLLLTFAEINFLRFAVLLFVVCSVTLVAVSLLTPPPPEGKTAGLTFGTLPREPGPRAGWRRSDVVASVVLALCVVGLWVYFS